MATLTVIALKKNKREVKSLCVDVTLHETVLGKAGVEDEWRKSWRWPNEAA